jgi:hypothetical protein
MREQNRLDIIQISQQTAHPPVLVIGNGAKTDPEAVLISDWPLTPAVPPRFADRPDQFPQSWYLERLALLEEQ